MWMEMRMMMMMVVMWKEMMFVQVRIPPQAARFLLHAPQMHHSVPLLVKTIEMGFLKFSFEYHVPLSM